MLTRLVLPAHPCPAHPAPSSGTTWPALRIVLWSSAHSQPELLCSLAVTQLSACWDLVSWAFNPTTQPLDCRQNLFEVALQAILRSSCYDNHGKTGQVHWGLNMFPTRVWLIESWLISLTYGKWEAPAFKQILNKQATTSPGIGQRKEIVIGTEVSRSAQLSNVQLENCAIQETWRIWDAPLSASQDSKKHQPFVA